MKEWHIATNPAISVPPVVKAEARKATDYDGPDIGSFEVDISLRFLTDDRLQEVRDFVSF